MAHGLISLLRTFAWLRWRLLINYLKSATRRDTFGRFSRWIHVATPVVAGLCLVPVFLAVLALAAFAGWTVGSEPKPPEAMATVLRALLFAHFLGVIVIPLTLGGRSNLPSPSRFLLLPIERWRLHLVTWLSGLGDPWLVAGGASLVVMSLAIGWGGRPELAAVALVASVLYVLSLAALGAWFTSAIQLLMRQRRRRDTISFILLVVMVFGGIGLSGFGEDTVFLAVIEGILFVNVFGELFVRTLFPWPFAGGALVALVGQVVVGLLLFKLSERLQHRLLTQAEVSAGPRRRSSGLAPGRRLHGCLRACGFSAGTAAVAEVQVRTLLRTVPGKMALFQGVIVVLLAGVSIARKGTSEFSPYVSTQLLLLCAAFSFVYLGMLQFLFNQLALDRAGLTLQFLLPISPRDLVHGKSLGFGILSCASFLLAAVPALWLTATTWTEGLWNLAVAFLLLVAMHLSLAPLAALLSGLLPRTVNLASAFAMNQPNSFAFLLGMLGMSMAFGIPATLVGLGTVVWKSPGLTLVLLLVWIALIAFALRLLLPVVGDLWWSRREEVLHVAGGD